MLIATALLLSAAAVAHAGVLQRAPTEAERARFIESFARLGSDSYNERKAASDAIKALGAPVLGLLEEKRDDPDPEVKDSVERIIKAIKLDIARRRIVRLIEETGVDDDPEELLKKYNSPKEEERLQALLRLSVRNTPACVPIVREFLDDPSEKIVDTAITQLREVIEGKDAQIALRILKIVGQTSTEEERIIDRINVFLSFADYREHDLVEAVKNLQDKKAREMVFTRMVLVPEENFVFAFAAMLDNEDRFTRRYCAGGVEVIVREILQKQGRELFSFDEQKRRQLIKTLARHLGSEDPVVVNVATGAIGRTGIPASIDRLAALLSSKDISTARRAAISLGLMKAKKAVPALIKVLQDGNYEVLPESADALARIGDPASFAPLLALLRKKEIPFRELLLYALTQVDLKRSAEELASFLSDSDVAVRSLAVDRLVKAMRLYPAINASETPGLLRIIREGEARGKTAAARVLGEVGGIAILPELKKLADSGDPQVRSAVFLPVAMIARGGARTLLEKNLKDPDYGVRVRAGEALGYLGDWSEFLKVRLVPLEVIGDSVVDALRRIAWATGMNLVIDPGAIRMCSLDTAMVRSALKGKTLSEALDALAELFDLSWNPSHYVLFVTVKARKGVIENFSIPTAGIGCTEADLALEKKMGGRLSCDSVSEAIRDFFEDVGAKTGVTFALDKNVEQRLAEGLHRVDFTASDIPLGELLRLVLAPRGLTARIVGAEVVISAGK